MEEEASPMLTPDRTLHLKPEAISSVALGAAAPSCTARGRGASGGGGEEALISYTIIYLYVSSSCFENYLCVSSSFFENYLDFGGSEFQVLSLQDSV